MTCSLQNMGHCRPLAGLTPQSCGVLVFSGCFQPALQVLAQLLGGNFLHWLHFPLILYIQKYLCSTRPLTILLITSHHYLIRMKDRERASRDFTLGKEIDLWNNQTVSSRRLFFKKQEKYSCHFGVDLNQGICTKLFFSARDCRNLTVGQKWILCYILCCTSGARSSSLPQAWT